MASPPAALERRLGPGDAAAIVVSNVIGGGIFFVPPIVAAMVPNPMAMLGVWFLGGLLALAGAMAYAELAALHPRPLPAGLASAGASGSPQALVLSSAAWLSWQQRFYYT